MPRRLVYTVVVVAVVLFLILAWQWMQSTAVAT